MIDKKTGKMTKRNLTKGRSMKPRVAMIEDITERNRMEERLRESEEKYRAIVENSPNFIGILQDGILKYVNRAATERLGWTYKELVSPSFDPIEKVVAERFRGLIKENAGKRLRGEDAPPYEVSLITRDGSEIPVIVRASKIVYQGRPAIEFAFSDITERKRMEEELSRSSQFLGSVIENAYVWLNVLDNEQNVLVWNKAAEAMSGYSREEVVGHEKIWECLYPDQEYRKQITETVNDILQSGRTDVDVETKIRRKDGQTRIISWNERALTDQDGKTIGTIAIGHDITERKQMEERLRENEERFRRIFEEGPLGMALVRPDYRFVRVNKAFCTMLGYSEEELTTLKFTDITHPEDIKLGVELTEKMLRGEIPSFSVEKRYIKKNGEILSAKLTASFIRDREGTPMYSTAMIEDITERKRAEDKLRQSEERYRSLFDQMLDGTYRSTHEGRFVDVNPAFAKMFGYSSKQEMLAIADIKKQLYFSPEERGSHILDTGQEEVEVYRMRRKDGSEIWVEDHGRYVHDEHGNIIYHEGILRDVTERKRMEQEIKEHSKQLEALVEERTKKLRQVESLAAIGETAAMVGHDLRNPLQGITGAAYNIRKQLRNAPDPSTKEMLAVIDNGIEYANGIINDLLEFSREMQLQPLPTTPKSMVKQTLTDVKIPNNITIEDTTADAPEILADEPKLRRVLTNLIENAIDAMPEGGKLSISSMNTQQEVSISVRDTGIGILQDMMEKIWTPLYTTKAKGIGLGLPICRRIVEAHGGSISVESTVGKGTTFTLKLPIQEVQGGELS